MKKILLAVILFSTVAMIIQSCSKNEEMKKDKSLNLYSSASSDETEAKIIRFIDRMDLVREDPNYPGSTDWNYSEDSAIWYIEAALNYDYSYPNEDRTKLYKDSLFIEISKSANGNISIDEIQAKFDITKDTLTKVFNSIESNHKFLVSVDYKLISSNSSPTKMIAYYYFGTKSAYLPDGDWVIVGGNNNNGGICGINSFTNYDGTNKLEQEIFSANTIHQANVFFTNIIYDDLSVANYIVINYNFMYTPCEVWVLYEQEEWNPNNFLTCLNFSFMNVYEDNMVNTLNSYSQSTLRNSIVVDIDWRFKLINVGTEPYVHWYEPYVTTGIAHPRVYSPKGNYYN